MARLARVVAVDTWEWSSAAAHCGTRPPDACLEMSEWEKRWGVSAWDEYLRQGGGESELSRIRQCTHTGRPLGSGDFVKELERSTQRRLAPQKGGRPPQPAIDQRQTEFGFDW